VSKKRKSLKVAKIVERLSTMSGPDVVPDGLIGATVAAFGRLRNDDAVEGGDPVIDFIRPERSEVERVVFGFNETGMWVAWPT